MARAGEEDKLFEDGDAASAAYRNLRDDEQAAEWKAFCELLWSRYRPYADPHFRTEIKSQFDQRFWEMYLGVTFLDRGYKLHKLKDGGPEFGIDIKGVRYWFDAIAPTSGTGPDAVPELEFGKPAASDVPEKQIILRITHALDEKRKKWRKDLASGRVSERDGFIVAINGRSIRGGLFGGDVPYVAKALYGLGHLVVSFDRKTLKPVDWGYEYRPSIAKASGTEISTQPFANKECPEVSAVLFSNIDAANVWGYLGDNLQVLQNDSPNVPLPRGALRFWREYWPAGGKLRTKDWSRDWIWQFRLRLQRFLARLFV